MHQNDTVGLPHKIKWITLCGLLMAINTIFSSFSVPVPGGHIYLNDIIIVIAALSLDPLGAFLVGGVGAFLGDFFFYPLPMFVSLATHGIRSVVMSLIVGRYGRDNFPVVLGATVLGALIAIAGYTPFRNTPGLHRIRHRTLPLEKQKMGSNNPPLPWVLTPYSP